MEGEIKVVNEALIEALQGLCEMEKGTGYEQQVTTDLINHSRGKMFAQTNDAYKALGKVEDKFLEIVKKTGLALNFALKKFDEADHAGVVEKIGASLGRYYENAAGVRIGNVDINSSGDTSYQKNDD